MAINRLEAIRVFALDAVADDYENFDIVFRNVVDLGIQCGLTASPSDALHALRDLIEIGFAKAYRLSAARVFEEFPGMPPECDLQGWTFGFLITDKGIQALRELAIRDEDGRLRKDWLVPEI